MNAKDLIEILENYTVESKLMFGESDKDVFQKVIKILKEDPNEDWWYELNEPIHDEDDDIPDMGIGIFDIL